MEYKKENWENVSIQRLKEHLENHRILNKLLDDKIVGFTHKEHIEIQNKLKRGEDLIKQVLKDKEDGVF